jgi:hypothetical protein
VITSSRRAVNEVVAFWCPEACIQHCLFIPTLHFGLNPKFSSILSNDKYVLNLKGTVITQWCAICHDWHAVEDSNNVIYDVLNPQLIGIICPAVWRVLEYEPISKVQWKNYNSRHNQFTPLCFTESVRMCHSYFRVTLL